MTLPVDDAPISPATGRPLTARGQQTRRRLLEAAESAGIKPSSLRGE